MPYRIAIVTYLYPNAIAYFEEFLDSLREQSYQEFELIIFNDGVSDIPKLTGLRCSNIFEVKGTPLEIRLDSIEILQKLDFISYIFCDADDTFSYNRVEVVRDLLAESDIVVNDLNTMTSDSQMLEKLIWEKRKAELINIDAKLLKEKNIIGLGNSAISANLLKKIKLKRSEMPMAADWFIFYQYLYFVKETKACFTSDCQTNYRQHEANTAGIKELTKERIEHIAKVKRAQYKALAEIGIDEFIPLKDSNFVCNTNLKNKTPFWWEEILLCKK